MDELQIKETIRDLFQSMASGDIKHTLALMTEAIEWVAPQGTFKGIEQIEKYLNWVYGSNKEYKITENGIGIIVQGNAAVTEHELSGTYTNGLNWSVPAVCIWEFMDGKIAKIRTFYDVLLQAQQLAKGMDKMAVNGIVNASRKGLA